MRVKHHQSLYQETLQPSTLPYHEYLYWNSQINTNTEQTLNTIKADVENANSSYACQTHNKKLQNKCLRISRQPTLNQVQNPYKHRNVLLIMNDQNEWRIWVTFWKDKCKWHYLLQNQAMNFESCGRQYVHSLWITSQDTDLLTLTAAVLNFWNNFRS